MSMFNRAAKYLNNDDSKTLIILYTQGGGKEEGERRGERGSIRRGREVAAKALTHYASTILEKFKSTRELCWNNRQKSLDL